LLELVGAATAHRNDLAALEEVVRNCEGLIEEASGIVAKIDDVALYPVLAEVRLDLVDRGFQSVVCLLGELADPNVADLAVLA
jgi:hypothetical protein